MASATHSNYLEIEAENHREMGALLGEHFSAATRAWYKDEFSPRRWDRVKREAWHTLDLTTRHFPQYVEELTTYAAASSLALLDFWTLINIDEWEGEEEDHCTTMVAEGGNLIAHNEDWAPEAAEEICILKKN